MQKFGTSQYLVLLITDGATNLLWATALTILEVSETLGASRLWIEENSCMPKGVVGDQAFFQDMFMDFYKFHGITPYPCGPTTPWRNRAETAVRLLKRAWVYMAKPLEDEGFVDKVTVCQAVTKVVWARNCQLTVSGYSPLEIATRRRPPDLVNIETSSCPLIHPRKIGPCYSFSVSHLRRIRKHDRQWTFARTWLVV